ncbi:MAG: protein kinase [Proteobacteria bacterium]|nr:protein kinase [Pseudomonadota bacterium]
MNARKDQTMLLSLRAADPLASLRAPNAAIADLAFGSLTADASVFGDGHLAILPAEALELDLTDPAQRRFGDYELLELIGRGGMGVVYRAHQASLDREVAIKLLAAGPWASREFIERFRFEAQNAARMQHPNIVAIYEVGAAEEMHFFSMRLVHGGSLASLLKREGRLDPRRAAQLLRTVAEAVDYAHRLGVLHLDLKPANVLLDETGAPHVADFGLARRLGNDLATTNTEVSGTPSYMAPEQATAGPQKITPATDIWGLGAILYELVTGEPPFLGESPQDTLKLVVDGQLRSPRLSRPNLPRDLAAIIEKCMVHEVAGRYANARELADDLGRFLVGYEVRARPLNMLQRQIRWARREPRLAITALLALLTLIVGLLATTQQWKRAETERQLAQKNEATSNTRLWESRRNAALRLQTDGQAFEALPALIDNVEEQEKAGLPASIERREIGMILSQGVTLIDRMIIPDAMPISAALSPDGSLLAIGLNNVSVRWYDTATLTERGRVDLLDQPTADASERMPTLLRFVDDHRLRVTLDWFSYVANPANINTFLVDLDKARIVAPPAAFADFAQADYSADGKYALLFHHDGSAQLWQVDPWKPLSKAELRHSSGDPWLLTRGGRYAVHFRQGMTGLTVEDPRNPAAAHEIEALANKRFTAWQESHDGSHVALGDEDGHLYLVDLKSLAVRTFPIPAGSEVTWIAFSEDDAWCAVARSGGDAFAFDVATGNSLHAGPLQHDFELRKIAISHRNNLLIASGEGKTTLWRMPEQGPDGGGTQATRITANPTRSARAGLYWSDASMRTGLLVTADMSGEVRLWRLPTDPVIDAKSTDRLTDKMLFDGNHVADVDYDRVRVAAVGAGTSTPWTRLPQPASYAELVDAAKTLVVICGHALHVFDAKTMRERYAPVDLPDTPVNVALRADGSFAVLAFGANRPNGFAEQLRTIDLATGKFRPGRVEVDGPIRLMQFSADESRLMVVGPRTGATEVFDTDLRRLGGYPHDPQAPVIWGSFTANASAAWLLTRNADGDAGNGRLILWDVAANTIREQRDLQGVWPIGVVTLGDKPLLATRDNLILDPGGPGERISAALHGGEATTVFAISAEQSLIAHSYGRNVQLFDASTLDAIGPPLAVNWRSTDAIIRLSFDPQDQRLLARLGLTHLLVAWPVRADERSVAQLRRDADLLAPAPRTRRVLTMVDPEQHAYLRSHDAGAWKRKEPRPAFAIARDVAGAPVPQRDPHASPLLLDLTDYYTMTPYSIRREADAVLLSTVNVPGGVVRLDGVDYDIRGGIELRSTRAGNRALGTDLRPRATGIHVPAVPIAALHVLMATSLPVPEPNERTYANVRLHYRDGSEALLPIRIQREVPGMSDTDRPTPIGWAADDLAVIGMPQAQVYSNPRLPNPHPERIIASLDLETDTSGGWSAPIFIAITAEPFDKLRAGSVIAATQSLTTHPNHSERQAGAAAKPNVQPRNKP